MTPGNHIARIYQRTPAKQMNAYFKYLVPYYVQTLNAKVETIHKCCMESQYLLRTNRTTSANRKAKDKGEVYIFSILFMQGVKFEFGALRIPLINMISILVGISQQKLCKQNIDLYHHNITNIFNCSINECLFPTKLKLADITPAHKKGDVTDKSNYRPVSLLPCLKVFEKLYSPQINKQMEQYFSKHLCGFRKD